LNIGNTKVQKFLRLKKKYFKKRLCGKVSYFCIVELGSGFENVDVSLGAAEIITIVGRGRDLFISN
jgi:hypothetical protein